VLHLDQNSATLAGQIAGELERTGRTIGLADAIIAATALSHELELVTGNLSHFVRIQEAGYPLALTNWRLM